MVGFDCKVEIHMNYFSIFTNIVCFNNFATPVQDFVGFDGQVTIFVRIRKCTQRILKLKIMGRKAFYYT